MQILQLHKILKIHFLFDFGLYKRKGPTKIGSIAYVHANVIMLRVGRFFNRARNEVMICGPKVARHEDASTGGIGVAGRLEITWHIIAKH